MEEVKQDSLSDVVNSGDDLEMLKRLRLGIARQLEETTSGRDMAALSKQFMDVTKEIAELEKSRPNPNRRTVLDEIIGKRKPKGQAKA